MKFSRRERFLIGLLIFVLMWAMALRIFIIPVYGRLVQNRVFLEEMEDEKARMDLYLKQFPDLEEKLAALDQKEEEEFFYRGIDDAFMDQDLQEMAGRAGMEISNMKIEGPAPMAEKDGEELPGERGGILETVVTMEMECPGVDQLEAFAREVHQEAKSVLVSYIDMKAEEDKAALKGIVEVRYYHEETD